MYINVNATMYLTIHCCYNIHKLVMNSPIMLILFIHSFILPSSIERSPGHTRTARFPRTPDSARQ